jgi:undecaprenyl phosphate N,N'-diacetylbacillosamine 1-phosphate transferase
MPRSLNETTNDLQKRAFDLLVAVPCLLLALPVLAIAASLIKLDSPGPVLFLQERVGRHNRVFSLFKLRTMTDRCEMILKKEVRSGDERVTQVGRYLRRFKLDELPQLLNVILGHMSVVGPRPDIPIQVEDYTDFQRRRLLARPGLTGVAQISGNTWLSWSERIILDVWYTENRSLGLDWRIIWHTVRVIFEGERPDADPLGLRARLLGSRVD